MSDTILELDHIEKHFGDTGVLHGVSLSVQHGEFVTLLGPSGCGKTTTLRIIAGLETPDAGRVVLRGKDVTAAPPEKRDVNTVFQNYALFPHMSVAANIGYSLRLKKMPRAEIAKEVDAALELVQLSGYGARMPAELSGGQRQRVAIARAIVNRPSVLLLDEPLGALDLKLRQEMQQELKSLQQKLGITFVYITHDQEEALNMSSRIVILNAGHIEQIGTPEEIYEHPRTLFAADFIGQNNLLLGTVTSVTPEGLTLEVNGVSLPALPNDFFSPAVGERAALCLRPQRIRYGREPQHRMALKGIIRSKEYVGGMQHTQIALNDALLLNAVTQSAELDSFPVGSEVYVGWNQRHAPLVPCTSKEAV